MDILLIGPQVAPWWLILPVLAVYLIVRKKGGRDDNRILFLLSKG